MTAIRPSPGSLALISLLALAGCGGGGGGGGGKTAASSGEELSGGAATTFAGGVEAFEQVAPNADADTRRTFELGNDFFESSWVTAPSSTVLRDGRGPLSNATACASCHLHDGRGRPDPALGLLIRLSSPIDASALRWGGASPLALALPAAVRSDPALGPVPGYGEQFQPFGLIGGSGIATIPGEGTVTITYTEAPGTYGDGSAYSLRQPAYVLGALAYGALPDGVRLSPRVAPAVIGDGLLEAIPDSRLIALADPDDADGDGVSGRLNHVPDLRTHGLSIGRFGWKAGVPTVEQQTASALHGDIGITTSLFPDEDLTAAQVAAIDPATLATRSGGSPEASDAILDRIGLYVRNLAVPVRRGWQTDAVVRGKAQFAAMGCAACHVPEHVTGPSATASAANQRIRPYTDLLLHDMGDGLADDRPEYEADGHEWRTPPLWGLGLTAVVSGHTFLLHDGRARSAAEAVLWHGGEGASARERFRTASAADRAALIAFLDSL